MTAAPAETSPRTESEPMAYTVDEFLRGAVAAWLWFIALFAATLIVVQTAISGIAQPGAAWGWFGVVMMYAVPVSALVAGAATLLFSPAAWGLGRMLRRQRRIVVHVVCFALLGAAVAAVVVLAYGLMIGTFPDFTNPFAVMSLACSAAAVPLGWGWTVRRALRADSGHVRVRRRADPDAEWEDAL